VSDCCLTTNEEFFSYNVARTSYIRWNDNDVCFVLDQPTLLDVDSAVFQSTSTIKCSDMSTRRLLFQSTSTIKCSDMSTRRVLVDWNNSLRVDMSLHLIVLVHWNNSLRVDMSLHLIVLVHWNNSLRVDMSLHLIVLVDWNNNLVQSRHHYHFIECNLFLPHYSWKIPHLLLNNNHSLNTSSYILE
jgi:hypothetical protein